MATITPANNKPVNISFTINNSEIKYKKITFAIIFQVDATLDQIKLALKRMTIAYIHNVDNFFVLLFDHGDVDETYKHIEQALLEHSLTWYSDISYEKSFINAEEDTTDVTINGIKD